MTKLVMKTSVAFTVINLVPEPHRNGRDLLKSWATDIPLVCPTSRITRGQRPSGDPVVGQRRAGHPVDDVASKPVPVGMRRVIEVVGWVMNHADFLHYATRTKVAWCGKRHNLVEPQRPKGEI